MAPKRRRWVRSASGVWRDSKECQSIRNSKYFQIACAKVLELRRELAAAKDYEQLDVRTRELRQALAMAPDCRDVRSASGAFFATFGRLLPLDGRVGVALLLTLVIEIMSCFGLAALRTLGDAGEAQPCVILPGDVGEMSSKPTKLSPVTSKLVPEGAENIPSNSSLTAAIWAP